jgi:hypothetical protein
MEQREMPVTEPRDGRPTSISRDPVGVDPIGNDPLDFGNPPKKGDGPNTTAGGWLRTATGVFAVVIVLAVIMVVAIFYFTSR